MIDLINNIELTRLAIVLGVIVGTLIYQRTGMTLGGVIIPGFFALLIPHPVFLLSILLISTGTYFFVHKFLLRRRLFYGHKLLEIEILTGLCLQIFWMLLITSLRQFSDVFPLFVGVGLVLPGIVAHDMARQGVRRTLISSLLGAVAVYLMVYLIGAFAEILPRQALIPMPLFRTQPQIFAFPLETLPYAIIVSVLLGIIVRKQFNLQIVGFATTAYFALLLLRPLDLALLVVCALITYALVEFGVKRVALVFGRAKLATMILVGVLISWGVEILLIYLSDGWLNPWADIKAIVPLLVALTANAFERQGLTKTALATTVSALVTVGVMQGVIRLLHWINPI